MLVRSDPLEAKPKMDFKIIILQISLVLVLVKGGSIAFTSALPGVFLTEKHLTSSLKDLLRLHLLHGVIDPTPTQGIKSLHQFKNLYYLHLNPIPITRPQEVGFTTKLF